MTVASPAARPLTVTAACDVTGVVNINPASNATMPATMVVTNFRIRHSSLGSISHPLTLKGPHLLSPNPDGPTHYRFYYRTMPSRKDTRPLPLPSGLSNHAAQLSPLATNQLRFPDLQFHRFTQHLVRPLDHLSIEYDKLMTINRNLPSVLNLDDTRW